MPGAVQAAPRRVDKGDLCVPGLGVLDVERRMPREVPTRLACTTPKLRLSPAFTCAALPGAVGSIVPEGTYQNW